MQNQTIVCSGAEAVNTFRLISLKHQLKFEAMGMRSSGGAIRPRIAKEFGLPARAPHAAFIAKIQELLDAAHAAQ